MYVCVYVYIIYSISMTLMEMRCGRTADNRTRYLVDLT